MSACHFVRTFCHIILSCYFGIYINEKSKNYIILLFTLKTFIVMAFRTKDGATSAHTAVSEPITVSTPKENVFNVVTKKELERIAKAYAIDFHLDMDEGDIPNDETYYLENQVSNYFELEEEELNYYFEQCREFRDDWTLFELERHII